MPGKILIHTALAALVLLAGCAAPPNHELLGARRAVAEAYIKEAYRLAPDEYRAASEALREGEQLVRQGRYERAGEVLSFAESHARRAELKAREGQARIEEEERRERQALLERQSPPVPTRIVPAAPKIEPPHPSPAPEPEPHPAPEPEPATRYTVTDGETLWTIAGDRDIYRDALLWPLLYRANRDQIKDPRQIYPGQVLNIPRDLTSGEKEEARETARQSDIFPLRELIGRRSPEDPNER